MKFDVVRAWKDEAYRLSLSEEDLCSLPENPVGELELTDADLEAVYGGWGSHGSGGGGSHNCQSHALICVSNNCRTFGLIC